MFGIKILVGFLQVVRPISNLLMKNVKKYLNNVYQMVLTVFQYQNVILILMNILVHMIQIINYVIGIQIYKNVNNQHIVIIYLLL